MKLHFIIALSFILFHGIAIGNNSKLSDSTSEIPVVQTDSSYCVIIEYDIVYAKGLSHESINSSNTVEMPLKLDVYTPDNDIKNRPAFVFVHGGGFAGGTKQQRQIIEWANYFTSRGWVFISIDYRLRKHKGTVPQNWFDYTSYTPKNKRAQFLAVYPAIRDAKAALRWVVANANTYHINLQYLSVGGGSAGAIAAIGMGVSNPEDYRDELSIEQDPTLTSTNLEQEYEVRTIINLWGSKIAIDALEEVFGKQRFDSKDPSLFITHGTEDPTVPFSKAEALKAIYEANGVSLAYYPLKGKRHGAWGAKAKGIPLKKLALDFIVEQQKLLLNKGKI